jgi:hypothetical protein
MTRHQRGDAGGPRSGHDVAERIGRQLEVVHDADRNAAVIEHLAIQQV